MSSQGDVRIQVDSQIANTADWLDCVAADGKGHIWELTLVTARCTPKNFGLGGIQLETVQPHTRGHVVDTLSYSFLES